MAGRADLLSEARRDDANLQALLGEFSRRPDAVFCSVGRQSARNCGVMAARFYRFVRRRGLPSRIWRTVGMADGPGVDPRWAEIPPSSRVHYVTEVCGVFVDWTRRQFDSTAACPAVYGSLDAACPDRDKERDWSVQDSELLHWRNRLLNKR